MRYEITMKSGAVVVIDAESIAMELTYVHIEPIDGTFPGQRNPVYVDHNEVAAIVVVDP